MQIQHMFVWAEDDMTLTV